MACLCALLRSVHTAGVLISVFSPLKPRSQAFTDVEVKVRDIHVPVPIVTNNNVGVYATPGKPLSWPGEPKGPINGWAPNSFLDGYFNKPGNPGGF